MPSCSRPAAPTRSPGAPCASRWAASSSSWARAEEGQWPDGTLSLLRELGFSCLALALRPDAVPLDEAPCLCGERRALVFGSEGPGLRRATLDACERSVVIPMARGVDSLNVAASSAVAFWQLFR